MTISEHVRERAGDFGCELTKLIEWNHRAREGREHAEEQTETVAISSLCGDFVLGWRYAGEPRGLVP